MSGVNVPPVVWGVGLGLLIGFAIGALIMWLAGRRARRRSQDDFALVKSTGAAKAFALALPGKSENARPELDIHASPSSAVARQAPHAAALASSASTTQQSQIPGSEPQKPAAGSARQRHTASDWEKAILRREAQSESKDAPQSGSSMEGKSLAVQHPTKAESTTRETHTGNSHALPDNADIASAFSPIDVFRALSGPPPSDLEDIDTTQFRRKRYAATLPDGLEVTDEFEAALGQIGGKHPCLFITGKAGTGKSTLLRYLLATSDRQVAVLAPTGLAAINVHGQTIHSFFGFPPHIISTTEIVKAKPNEACAILDALIIDEVSMVRADLMDGIDQVLRLKRNRPDEPFGGVQMVFFGDLFQLPPIIAKKEEADWQRLNYPGSFFFDAHVFRDAANIEVIELQRVFRQRHPDFIELLNRVRHNQLHAQDLQTLNSRYQHGFDAPDDQRWVTLATTNAIANQVNKRKLNELDGPSYFYEGAIVDDFDEDDCPTDIRLELRVGAQVMFIKNDVNRKWVNGTLGTVVSLSNTQILVQIAPDELPVEVAPVSWEAYAYNIDREKRTIEAEVVGTFTQYPLKLAWAMTIHKGQGRTFEKTVIDLGNGAFAHGQSYVALSRCTTLEGIVLLKKINAKDIIVDPRVIAFATK